MREYEEIDPLGWRLSESVVRGEIDSRKQGRVTGRIWLVDRAFPIEITLRGNPMRDIAGCLLQFENPNPMPEDNEGLSPIQMGVTGHITASCKIRVLDIKPDPDKPSVDAQEPHCSEVQRVANALKIEWFSNANGRVTILSSDFRLTLSAFQWRMTREEQEQQTEKNDNAFQRWRDIVAEENDELEPYAWDDDEQAWYMDEFEWERQFQESDAVTHRYMLLMESFLNHPDREKIIAHEMGWDWEDEDEDNIEDDWEPWETWEDDIEDLPSLQPNPETEGRDWVRTADGSIRHPLSLRSSELARKIWRSCKETNRNTQANESDLQTLMFQAQTLSAKLTGALDALAYDVYPDGGFIVACLKRALKAFENTVKSLGTVSQQDALPPRTIQTFREELFQIRQEILRLMQVYRNRQP